MQTSREEALKRLTMIEGHLRGIRKMVDEDAYCVDVLKQTYAVQRAIEKFEQILLRDHLNHCVPDGIREGRDEEVLNELSELFSLSRRSVSSRTAFRRATPTGPKPGAGSKRHAAPAADGRWQEPLGCR